jgi:hypothetical protein
MIDDQVKFSTREALIISDGQEYLSAYDLVQQTIAAIKSLNGNIITDLEIELVLRLRMLSPAEDLWRTIGRVSNLTMIDIADALMRAEKLYHRRTGVFPQRIDVHDT